MELKIENFEIINNGKDINIHVKTAFGYNITDILLWEGKDYGNYNAAVSLNSYLENVNEVENIIVSAEDLGFTLFDGIWFVEVYTDYTPEGVCEKDCEVVVGITYDLSKYYNCLINYIFDADLTSDCKNCPSSKNKDILLTLLLMWDSLGHLLETCMYEEAIQTFDKIKKLCSLKTCINCPSIVTCTSCKGFKVV